MSEFLLLALLWLCITSLCGLPTVWPPQCPACWNPHQSRGGGNEGNIQQTHLRPCRRSGSVSVLFFCDWRDSMECRVYPLLFLSPPRCQQGSDRELGSPREEGWRTEILGEPVSEGWGEEREGRDLCVVGADLSTSVAGCYRGRFWDSVHARPGNGGRERGSQSVCYWPARQAG